MFDASHDQENGGVLVSDWRQEEGEITASPVDAARAHFQEGTIGSLQWRIQATTDRRFHTAFLRTWLTTLREAEFDVTRHSLMLASLNWRVPTPAFGFEEFQTSGPESPQLSFGLRGVFTPSKDLTDFWVRGVKALAQEANVDPSGMELASTQLEIQQEFSKMLTSLVGTIGQRLKYGDKSDVNITRAGRFSLQYQIKICDRFLIIPDEAASFLYALRSEMITALAGDAVIEGAWGRVGVNSSGDLFYALVPPIIIRDDSFVPSEDIE
jgi:hypothetical protein